MVEKRFEKLGMPDIERFENYLPTAFNSELTLLQKVNKIIFDLIETNKLTNEMVDYLNKFIEKFDEKLYKTIEDVLQVWLEDGLLADVVRVAINEEVIEARTDYLGYTYLTLKERLNESDKQLAETARVDDAFLNGVVRGADLANGGGLLLSMSSGVAYLNGKRIVINPLVKSLKPSKDTYIDLKYDGTLAYVEVANGALEPPVTLNSIRIGIYETNATTITRFQRFTRNTVYGDGAYFEGGTGYDNIAIGFYALNKNKTGHRNTVVGVNALANNTDGDHNIAVGQNALLNNTVGEFNTALGIDGLRGNTTGGHNVAIAQYALLLNDVGNSNIGIGVSALSTTENGDGNIGIGEYALASQNGVVGNVGVGTNALRLNQTGQALTAIGNDSGRLITSGVRNTLVGSSAGYQMTTGDDNVGIGAEALKSTGVASKNTGVGNYTLLNNTGGSSVGVGYQSLQKSTTGVGNTGVGLQAGYQITTGVDNTFIGIGSGGTPYQSDGSVSNATAIGARSVINESNAVQLGDTSVTKVYTHGDFECKDKGDGFVCKSPNGTRYRITVSDSGTPIASAL